MEARQIKARLKGMGIAFLGALAFLLLGLPLPFLFGPLLACLVAALWGCKFDDVGRIGVAVRIVLGVAAEASITPDVIHAIPQMLLTVALVPLFIALVACLGLPFFRAMGFDRTTAWYGAMPGGLQDMVLFGQEAGGDPRALSLIHATRVLLIITLAPLIASYVYGVSFDRPVGASIAGLPPAQIGLMILAGLGGWKVAIRIRLFGAAILGPLIAAALLAQAGLLTVRPPREAITSAQFLIGLGIGAHYVGVTWMELRRYLLAAAAFVMMLAICSALFTEFIHFLDLAPPVEAFLAFAPGGQAEMALMALLSGADVGFVVVHHIVRMMVVIICAPIVFSILK